MAEETEKEGDLSHGPCLQEAYVLVREAYTNPVNQKIKLTICEVSVTRLGAKG